MRKHLIAEYRSVTGRDLKVYLDKERIATMDNWRHNVLEALRRSRFLLVCVSPDYFKSAPCRWEWQEYLHRQVKQLMGTDTSANVYFVKIPDELRKSEEKPYLGVALGSAAQAKHPLRLGLPAISGLHVAPRQRTDGGSARGPSVPT